MATDTNAIAAAKDLYSKYGVTIGNDTNQCPAKSLIVGAGLIVEGTYSEDQLVKFSDITNYYTFSGFIEIKNISIANIQDVNIYSTIGSLCTTSSIIAGDTYVASLSGPVPTSDYIQSLYLAFSWERSYGTAPVILVNGTTCLATSSIQGALYNFVAPIQLAQSSNSCSINVSAGSIIRFTVNRFTEPGSITVKVCNSGKSVIRTYTMKATLGNYIDVDLTSAYWLKFEWSGKTQVSGSPQPKLSVSGDSAGFTANRDTYYSISQYWTAGNNYDVTLMANLTDGPTIL